MPTYGLQFSTIKTRVKRYASINNIEGADTNAGYAVNDALRKMAAERRWIALRRSTTITPIASTQSYSLASVTDYNFPVRLYYLSNGQEQDIDIVDEDVWSEKSDNDSVGSPSIAIIRNISGAWLLYVSPLPSAAFVSLYSTLYFEYDKKPTELSADDSIPDIPDTNSQMALVYYAVAELCLGQGDLQGSSSWEIKGQAELAKYSKNDINRRTAKSKVGKPAYGILHGTYGRGTSKDY